MVIATGFDVPGSTNTFRNPTSRLGGCPSTGTPRRTCTTSAPATGPVLVTDAVTVTGPRPAPGASTATSEMSKVVWESPKPKPNSGSIRWAGNQRYPTSRPSEYRIPGKPAPSAVPGLRSARPAYNVSHSDRGYVVGSFPDGFEH